MPPTLEAVAVPVDRGREGGSTITDPRENMEDRDPVENIDGVEDFLFDWREKLKLLTDEVWDSLLVSLVVAAAGIFILGGGADHN